MDDLRRLVASGVLDAGRRQGLATRLGELSRRAHDAGLFQDDFAPNNILVPRGDKSGPVLIDFERARLRCRVGFRQRRWMLAKLDRALPDIPARDRLAFLRAYCRGDRAAARIWWQRLRALAPRLAARDSARMERTTTANGRRFQRLSGPGWHGFARREISSAQVRAAAECAPADSATGWCIQARDGAWQIHYPGLSGRRARSLWARANLLFARGCGPRPLACVIHRGGALLLAERRPGVGEAGGPRRRASWAPLPAGSRCRSAFPGARTRSGPAAR